MNPVPAIAARSAIGRVNAKRTSSICQAKAAIDCSLAAWKFVSIRAVLSLNEDELPPSASPTSAGALLHLIREEVAVTRADLARVTGLARSTVAQRVDTLLAKRARLRNGRQRLDRRPSAERAGLQPRRRRRPRRRPRRDPRPPRGERPGRDAAGRACRRPGHRARARAGARMDRRTLRRAARGGRTLRRRRARHRGRRAGPGRVRQRAAGQPADHARLGRLPDPGVVRRAATRAPVLVDNDVNIMARGEHWMHWRDTRAPAAHQGRHRHRLRHRRRRRTSIAVRAARPETSATSERPSSEDVVCRCGNIGCLEAIAGGQALAERLSAQGLDAARSRDVVRLVRSGDAGAIRMVRDAGRTLGEVLAGTRQLLQPGRDRDRRRHRRGARAAARGRARGDLQPVASARDARPPDRSVHGSATVPA